MGVLCGSAARVPKASCGRLGAGGGAKPGGVSGLAAAGRAGDMARLRTSARASGIGDVIFGTLLAPAAGTASVLTQQDCGSYECIVFLESQNNLFRF